jgi:hypothetical protein
VALFLGRLARVLGSFLGEGLKNVKGGRQRAVAPENRFSNFSFFDYGFREKQAR